MDGLHGFVDRLIRIALGDRDWRYDPVQCVLTPKHRVHVAGLGDHLPSLGARFPQGGARWRPPHMRAAHAQSAASSAYPGGLVIVFSAYSVAAQMDTAKSAPSDGIDQRASHRASVLLRNRSAQAERYLHAVVAIPRCIGCAAFACASRCGCSCGWVIAIPRRPHVLRRCKNALNRLIIL